MAYSSPCLSRSSSVSVASSGNQELDFIACDRVFTNSQAAIETESVVQLKKDLDADSEHPIDLFLVDDQENTLPECDVDMIRDLCPPILLNELECNDDVSTAAKPKEQRAWLDDRSETSREGKYHREYKLPLPARKLYQHLKDPRFDHSTLPNADRRLIYIENLDGAYIYALAQTATMHQADALREAIAAYQNFETNFSLAISYSPANYRLSMYLSFPVVLMSSCIDKRPDHLPWLCTTFTQADKPDQKKSYPVGIYTARKTVEICGLAYTNYSAWAFADTLHTDASMNDKTEHQFPYGVSELDDSFVIHEDPIVSGSCSLDANMPVMDIRDYGLRIFKSQVDKALKHWNNVIGHLKTRFKTYEIHINELLATRNPRPGRRRNERIKHAYKQTRRWRDLISTLYTDLTFLINSLDAFCGPNGPMEFLTRMPSDAPDRIYSRVRLIKRYIERLHAPQKELNKWYLICDRLSAHLDLWLKLDANERSVETSQTTVLTVQIITPIMLSIGVCSMNKETIPFPLSNSSLPFTIFASFAVFMFIQRFVSVCHEGWDWWKESPAPGNKDADEDGVPWNMFRFLRPTRTNLAEDSENGVIDATKTRRREEG